MSILRFFVRVALISASAACCSGLRSGSVVGSLDQNASASDINASALEQKQVDAPDVLHNARSLLSIREYNSDAAASEKFGKFKLGKFGGKWGGKWGGKFGKFKGGKFGKFKGGKFGKYGRYGKGHKHKKYGHGGHHQPMPYGHGGAVIHVVPPQHQPVYNQPVYHQPVYPQPVYHQPANHPGYVQPNPYGHQGYVQPNPYGHQGYVQPNPNSHQGYVQPNPNGHQGYMQPNPYGHQGYVQPTSNGHQGSVQPGHARRAVNVIAVVPGPGVQAYFDPVTSVTHSVQVPKGIMVGQQFIAYI